MLFSPQILLRPRQATVVAAASAQSIVLTAASSQYLSKTWGNAPTDPNISTLNFWVKRVSVQSALANFYDGGIWNGHAGVDEADLRFDGADTLTSVLYNGGVLSQATSTDTIVETTTWHNIHALFDSTDATANNRCRIYKDGTEVSYGTQTARTQNATFGLALNGVQSAIGRHQASTGRYLDAKLAYFYFIDGQALTPSSFTTGTGSGTTHPAAYGGTYGTNGFFLNFTGSSPNDAANGNHWTANNSPTYSADIPT